MILPLANEASLIADEFKRNIYFTTKMIRDVPEDQKIMEARTDVVVCVENHEEGYYYHWDIEEVQDRLIVLRDMYNKYIVDKKMPVYASKEQDPFYNPLQSMLIGTTYISLTSLSYMLGTNLSAKLLSSEGAMGVRGTVDVSYKPCAADGVGEIQDDQHCDEPGELVGK